MPVDLSMSIDTQTLRAVVYIDGYNLYYGMREAPGGKYKWI